MLIKKERKEGTQMSHFYLQGFHDVDIVKSLQEIAEKNTVFYKTDFLIDKQIVKEAA